MSNKTPLGIRQNPNKISRNAGAFRGSLSSWRVPHTFSLNQQAHERTLSQSRAADLAANDWAASSGLKAITTNAVGIGLKPQSRLNAKALGITRKVASELQQNMEAIWAEWTPRAHALGSLSFEDLQLLGLRTMLLYGELLHLPVISGNKNSNQNLNDRSGGQISLAIQNISPTRLRTPSDLQHHHNIIDGVEFDSCGIPQAYWLATPTANSTLSIDMDSLASSQFTRIPAKVGHRPGCFHLFRHQDDEQVRGESIFNPGINLFRHLSDSVDHELLSQVVTSSLSLFIAREDGSPLANYIHTQENDDSEDPQYYEDINPGTILYGNPSEKPHMLESSRPSPNFAAFCEFTLRAMAASIDMPYEVLAKDFSKTNYSSARAALLEAWRVYTLYRTWLSRHYCQPIWGLVMEEAWLSGMLKLPAGAPDFYEAYALYTQAIWIGPPRGYVDPVKEITATTAALDHNLMTYSEAIAERGRDFEEVMDEREEEERRLAQLNKAKGSRSALTSAPGENPFQDTAKDNDADKDEDDTDESDNPSEAQNAPK